MRAILKQLLCMNLVLLLIVLSISPAIAEGVQDLKYTLTLHKNDGSSEVKSVLYDFEPEKSYSLAEYLFKRDTSIQVAWADAEDGDATHRLNALYVPVTSTDLYAYWLELEDVERNSGVVVLNSLAGDLDTEGTFYQKSVNSVVLPDTLQNISPDSFLAWCTQLRPEAERDGVFSGQWYSGGETVAAENGEILTLYGQTKDETGYVIYDSNGGSVQTGGSIIVQKAEKSKHLDNIVEATLIGDSRLVAPEHDKLEGWAYTKDANSAQYKPGGILCFDPQKPQVLYAVWTHSHRFGEYIANNDATCLEDGTKTAVCENGCGEVDVVIDEGSATGHMMGEWVQTSAPSCTQNGEEKQSCMNCEHENVREILTTGHLDGNKDYICDICKAELCTTHVYDSVKGYIWSAEGCKAVQMCSICGGGRNENDVTFNLTADALKMSHAPSDVLVFIAAYEDGQMIDVSVAEAAEEIPYAVRGSEIRAYFLKMDTHEPLMNCLTQIFQ